MDIKDIAKYIQENYRKYRWNVGWEGNRCCFYSAQVNGGEYIADVFKRYGTGNVYLILTTPHCLRIDYYPKDGGIHCESIDLPTTDLYNAVIEKSEQDRMETEKIKKEMEAEKTQAWRKEMGNIIVGNGEND